MIFLYVLNLHCTPNAHKSISIELVEMYIFDIVYVFEVGYFNKIKFEIKKSH